MDVGKQFNKKRTQLWTILLKIQKIYPKNCESIKKECQTQS
jgi:hypothetical protein